MASLRKTLRSIRDNERRPNYQLSPREIKADATGDTLKKIKIAVLDCKELHRKWEKDKHFVNVNSDYLARANKLLCVVDEYRQQLELPWPKVKSTEIDELKACVNKLARERDDAEYRLEEAELEIDRLTDANRHSDEIANATKALNTARDEAARYKKQMETSNAIAVSLRQSLSKEENLQKEIVRLQQNITAEQEAKAEALVRNQQEIEKLKSQYKDLQESMEYVLQSKDELDLSLRDSLSREGNLREEICTLQRHLLSEKEAKIEVLMRLSAVADNKFSDNNSTIPYLSDPIRPMKLAEKVSELFDNEWTNAMENLENDMDEKVAIKVLLDIVTKVFITFEDIGDTQTDFISSLELSLAVPDIDELQDVARSALLNKGKLTKLPIEITKQLKDYRKASCHTVNPLLFELMKSRLQRIYHMDEKTIQTCDQFIKETVLYVWMMRVQDPPVHIEWEFSHGEKFDHDRLRTYTKGGDRVDYVVWPILYLHKGGPMLAKGVAQGMKSKPK